MKILFSLLLLSSCFSGIKLEKAPVNLVNIKGKTIGIYYVRTDTCGNRFGVRYSFTH